MLEVMFLLSQGTWATDITGNASVQVQRREKKTERSLFFCLHCTALHVHAGSLRLYLNILYQNLYCYFLRENFKLPSQEQMKKVLHSQRKRREPFQEQFLS